MKKFFALISILALPFFSMSQITGFYSFNAVTNLNQDTLLATSSQDSFALHSNLTFDYNLAAKNNLKAHGLWEKHGPILKFVYSQPKDTTRFYEIITANDSVLVLQENKVQFHFNRFKPKSAPLALQAEASGLNHLEFKKNGAIQTDHFFKGLIGLIVLLFITFLFSANKRNINWAVIVKGVLLQLVLAIVVLKVPKVDKFFEYIAQFFVKILDFTKEGSTFLFGPFMDTSSYGFIFALQVLPTVIFFSALTSLLYYYGILQKIVWVFAWLMKKTLKLSGSESLAAAGNIFLGQTEAPLLIKPYIKNMTLSELMCLMSGGMATIAGAVLAAYIGFLGGDDEVVQLFFAQHLLTASVMSAPAAVVAAKILLPETEKVNQDMTISKEAIGENWLEAIANGTSEGLRLAVNVGAMLLVFTAMMALVNSILGDVIGDVFHLNQWVMEITDARYSKFSMEFILGYTLAPLTWVMGVAKEDIAIVGQLLGEKTILNEFYAYTSMRDYIQSGAFTDQRSVIIATYILCGFSNFASIGIQIGGIGALAPSRRKDLSKLGIKALIGGTMASLYTAVIVGMLI